jgi:purine-binding chemotaxis protein CheW
VATDADGDGDTDTDSAAAEDDLDTADYVTFQMAAEDYAFPMERVHEIIRVPGIVRLPLGPESLEGLANLRGRVLPVVSLRSCCGLDRDEHDDTTRVIVVDGGGSPLGFVVDRVSSVISVDRVDVEAADTVRATVSSKVLAGVIKNRDTGMISVLDIDRLVESEFSALAGQAARGVDGTSALHRELDANDAGGTLELVSFAVDGQEYALPIDRVQEIVQAPESVARVPNAQARVLGVMDLRGRLLPVVSMRQVFGLPVTALEPHNRIVVVSLGGGGMVGIVMDTVREVLRVPRDLVAELPAVVAEGGRSTEIEAVCRLEEGRRLVSVLSVGRMFADVALLQEIVDSTGPDPAAQTDDPPEGPQVPAEMNAGPDDVRPDDVRPDDAGPHDAGPAVADGRGEEELLVVFRLDEEEYGVDVDSVQEIIRVPEALIKVPKAFDFVEGLVNLRGTVLPVMDLRTRLGISRCERDERQRIVVLILDGVRTGFIVDSVAEVARIPRAALEPAPELSKEQARLVSRVANLTSAKRMLLLIEPQQLLAPGQAAALAVEATKAA